MGPGPAIIPCVRRGRYWYATVNCRQRVQPQPSGVPSTYEAVGGGAHGLRCLGPSVPAPISLLPVATVYGEGDDRRTLYAFTSECLSSPCPSKHPNHVRIPASHVCGQLCARPRCVHAHRSLCCPWQLWSSRWGNAGSRAWAWSHCLGARGCGCRMSAHAAKGAGFKP